MLRSFSTASAIFVPGIEIGVHGEKSGVAINLSWPLPDQLNAHVSWHLRFRVDFHIDSESEVQRYRDADGSCLNMSEGTYTDAAASSLPPLYPSRVPIR